VGYPYLNTLTPASSSPVTDRGKLPSESCYSSFQSVHKCWKRSLDYLPSPSAEMNPSGNPSTCLKTISYPTEYIIRPRKQFNFLSQRSLSPTPYYPPAPLVAYPSTQPHSTPRLPPAHPWPYETELCRNPSSSHRFPPQPQHDPRRQSGGSDP